MWFFGDPARLQRERAAVADLMSDADWLQDVDWGLTTEARIKLDFAIVVGEQRFSLRMTYPKLFPFTPPEVARLVMTGACLRTSMAMQQAISACSTGRIIGCRPSRAPT